MSDDKKWRWLAGQLKEIGAKIDQVEEALKSRGGRGGGSGGGGKSEMRNGEWTLPFKKVRGKTPSEVVAEGDGETLEWYLANMDFRGPNGDEMREQCRRALRGGDASSGPLPSANEDPPDESYDDELPF